jgi:hypothetical protein
MRANENELTKLYLQLCYTCLDAHNCETEEKCMKCWVEKETAYAEETMHDTTEELLRQYAL